VRAIGYGFQAGPRTTSPGNALVMLPCSITATPFTSTYYIPLGQLIWPLERGEVGDDAGIDDHNVGPHAAAVGEPQMRCGRLRKPGA
jgi:hypothetical protein